MPDAKMEKTKQKNSLITNFVSWNVRGMRKIAKIKQVINRIKFLKSKIVFLQETHLFASDINSLTKRWQGQVFHASFNSHARGVLILIHKSIPFRVTKTIEDKYGSYIIVQGMVLSQKLNLINVYGPNDDNPSFFEQLFLTVAALDGPYVIRGDFNCVLDTTLDRSTQTDTTHVRTRKTLLNYIHDLRLTEVWKAYNPNKREYSCYSSSYKSHSRIDYFLVSVELMSCVKNCFYNGIVISDHAAVSMDMEFGGIEQSSGRWRRQVIFLQDPAFVKFIGSCIDKYFDLTKNETTASVRWEAFKAYTV